MNELGKNKRMNSSDLNSRRLMFLLAGAVLLIGSVVLGLNFLTSSQGSGEGVSQVPGASSTLAEPGIYPPGTPTPADTPGVVFFGYVRDHDGLGVQDIEIYRRYAGYPGVLVAITDDNGYYLSVFYSIPGDEMITLWAVKSGSIFSPEYYYWRHYYGYEGAQHDFLIQQP